MFRTAIFAAMTAAVFAPFAVHAQNYSDNSDTRSIEVRYDDLNLGSLAGIALFDARIRRAADRVCNADDTQDLAGHMRARACRTVAIAAVTPARQLAIAGTRPRVAVR